MGNCSFQVYYQERIDDDVRRLSFKDNVENPQVKKSQADPGKCDQLVAEELQPEAGAVYGRA